MTSIATNTMPIVDELSLRLRDFHRALITAEAGDDPSLKNPYTFLFAVLNDPRFAWTGKLSQLIVKLDEEAAEGELNLVEHLCGYRDEVVRLLNDGNNGDAEFRLRHLMALQKDPDVALATGALRRVLARIPATQEASPLVH